MAEISILLPSLRPDAASRVVKEFLLTNSATDYEIIVVSPFKVDGRNVLHVLEQERHGVMFAVNQAYKNATGEYIVVWSDDATPERNCLEHIVGFVKAHDAPFVGSFRIRDIKGRESEQWSVYGKPYAGWLCTSKKTIEAVGGLFDLGYKNYWADPDLALRIWSSGGKVEVCPNAWIKVTQIEDKVKADNLKSSFDADTKVFFDRWHDKFGNKSKRIWTDINVQVPHSFIGRIRSLLRKMLFLRKIKKLVFERG